MSEAWQGRKEREKAFGPPLIGARGLVVSSRCGRGVEGASLSLLRRPDSVSRGVLVKMNNRLLSGVSAGEEAGMTVV